MILHMDAHQVAENSEDFEKPYDYDNYNNDVENVFDFPIHRNIRIDQP